MKKEKPAVINELSLNEFILVFKYFMRKTNCAHVTGFVNAPLLYAKPNETELEQLINLAIKHGTLVRNGNEETKNNDTALNVAQKTRGTAPAGRAWE